MDGPETEHASTPTEVATPRSDAWLKAVLIGRNPRFTLARVVVLVVTTFILFKYVFIPIEVVGISMEPTFVEGQIRLVNKLAYRNAEPQRGDVVAVRMKTEVIEDGDLFALQKRGDVVAVRMKTERVVLLKRIIGLPGERIRFAGKKIYVNGQPLEESYVKRTVHPSWHNPQVDRLPKDQYLVIGDNRSMPFNDHYSYHATRDEILGKVSF